MQGFAKYLPIEELAGIEKKRLMQSWQDICGKGMCVVKEKVSLAGSACKVRFDKREFRKIKPFFKAMKRFCFSYLLIVVNYLSSFNIYFAQSIFYGSTSAKKYFKLNSAFSLSFRLNLPILLIDKQNQSQLVIRLGLREKMWQS